jgi:hypothetical protein
VCFLFNIGCFWGKRFRAVRSPVVSKYGCPLYGRRITVFSSANIKPVVSNWLVSGEHKVCSFTCKKHRNKRKAAPSYEACSISRFPWFIKIKPQVLTKKSVAYLLYCTVIIFQHNQRGCRRIFPRFKKSLKTPSRYKSGFCNKPKPETICAASQHYFLHNDGLLTLSPNLYVKSPLVDCPWLLIQLIPPASWKHDLLWITRQWT